MRKDLIRKRHDVDILQAVLLVSHHNMVEALEWVREAAPTSQVALYDHPGFGEYIVVNGITLYSGDWLVEIAPGEFSGITWGLFEEGYAILPKTYVYDRILSKKKSSGRL